MEIVLYPFAVIVVSILVFIWVERPYLLGGVILFMLLYQFNIETPLPLDARGLLTLSLFVRLYVFDKENMLLINRNLLKNKYFWLLVAFIFIILVFPIIHSEKITKHLKTTFLAVINLIIGFLLVKTEDGRKALIFGILLAGILSAIDLIFTFSTTGSLLIIKVIDLILGRKLVLLNHNYPGLLSALGLLVIYFMWYRTKSNIVILILLSALLSLGIIISTSRSALLGFFIVLFLATYFEYDMRHNLKKIIPIGILLGMFLVGFFFIYNVFYVKSGSSSYIDKIYYRLYEEPFDMLTGKELNKFDKYSGQRVEGSMTFRANRWKKDLDKFMSLNLASQILGLGPKGYMKIAEKVYRKSGSLKYQLPSHNGYLLILMERGYLGLFLISFIFVFISFRAIKTTREINIVFPMIYILLVFIFYSFAQNSELTGSYTFLIIGSVLGNIIHTELEFDEEEFEEDITEEELDITQ